MCRSSESAMSGALAESSEELYRAAVAQAKPPQPRSPRPIVVIGAGGIVRAAQLPAYAKAEFPVIALADVAAGKAAELAWEFGVARSFERVEEAVAWAP